MSAAPDLKTLIERLRSFRDARDWSKFHSPRNLAASVAIEAGELLEIFQWVLEGDEVTSDQRSKVADEAADVFIYLLLLCDQLGLDLAASAASKIERNEARFPLPLNPTVFRTS